MIKSAEEFIKLLTGTSDSYMVVHEEISEKICHDIIDNYPDEIIWVVRNKTVPLSILRQLSDHPDSGIRHGVASKRKIDRELFEKLSTDEDSSVRQRIACNKKVPRDILERLVHDPVEFVAEVAIERLKERW